MALDIKKTNDSKSMGLSALIYAASGVGKTTLLGTLPGKTLIIDVEGGTASLRDKELDYVSIQDNLENLKEVMMDVQDPGLGYNNIVLDSATELEKFMLIYFAKNNAKNEGVPQLADYQKAQFKMREYLRIMRDLREIGVNSIITALEMPLKMEENDGIMRSKLYPMMMNKLAPEACGLFDIVGHMEISKKEDTKGTRFIRLSGTDDIIAKDRIFKSRAYCAATGDALFLNETAEEEKPAVKKEKPADKKAAKETKETKETPKDTKKEETK